LAITYITPVVGTLPLLQGAVWRGQINFAFSIYFDFRQLGLGQCFAAQGEPLWLSGKVVKMRK
jgi:hypothetical protein